MPLIRSKDNPLFKELRDQTDSARARRRAGVVVLEGIHLVRAYEENLGPVQTLVISEPGMDHAEIAALRAGRKALCLSEALFGRLCQLDNPDGLLAIAAVPPPPSIDRAADSVLLDGVQDPGNVGTVLRTAAAAGFRQILCSPGCAAPWSPKVLRAGQGAHFAAHIVEDADLSAFLAAFQGNSLAAGLDGESLFAVELPAPPLAWIFGSEGRGIRPELAAATNRTLTIPMPGRVESLNIGAAAAICLFESLRQRRA